jgi:hypothetical protein
MGSGYSDFVRKGRIYSARDGADNMPPGTVKYGDSWGTTFRKERKDQSSPPAMKETSIPHCQKIICASCFKINWILFHPVKTEYICVHQTLLLDPILRVMKQKHNDAVRCYVGLGSIPSTVEKDSQTQLTETPQ